MVIQGLSEKGKQLYHFILSGIQKGLSGAEILRQLRELGEGYRIQDFYNDLRIIKGETLKWDTMKYVRRDRVITEDLYTPAVKTKAPFITRFYVELYNPITGEVSPVYVSVAHTSPMRREDLEDIALQYITPKVGEYEEWSKYEVRKIYPVGGFRQTR